MITLNYIEMPTLQIAQNPKPRIPEIHRETIRNFYTKKPLIQQTEKHLAPNKHKWGEKQEKPKIKQK